jgi:hypothetical protein
MLGFILLLSVYDNCRLVRNVSKNAAGVYLLKFSQSESEFTTDNEKFCIGFFFHLQSYVISIYRSKVHFSRLCFISIHHQECRLYCVEYRTFVELKHL